MGIHRQRARKGVERLDVDEVSAEAGVGGVEYIGEQAELCDGGSEGRQHEVADSKEGKSGDEGGSKGGFEDEEEHLADVVVALEVTEEWMPSQDFDDEVG